ncbi:MAG: acetoacetate decarboxylase family protein [Elainella sp.]
MYPPPPWTLKGHSLQSLHLLDIEQVRASVPAELQILSPWPGKTLGGLFVAAYQQGSTLVYSELIGVSALVYAQGKLGAWISHIYVDNPDSVAGGREIWGLPKQLAQFTWNADRTAVQVSQDGQRLCSLTRQNSLLGLPLVLIAPVLTKIDERIALFTGQVRAKLHLTDLNLEIPPESPLTPLQLNRPLLSFYADPLTLVANPPGSA